MIPTFGALGLPSNINVLTGAYREMLSQVFVSNMANGLGVNISLKNPSPLLKSQNGNIVPVLLDTNTGSIIETAATNVFPKWL